MRAAADDYVALKRDLVATLRAHGFGHIARLQAATGFTFTKTKALLLGHRHLDLFDYVVLCRLVDSVVARIEKGEVAASPPLPQVQRVKGPGRK